MKGLLKWLKKYFIPHGENDFKPHFLRHEASLFFFLVIIIVELGFLTQVFIVFDKTNFLAAVLPGILTTLTNEERAHINDAPLVTNNLLTKAAELKANDMATRGYFAHTSPDGKTPWYWLDQVGYNYNSAGENLAVNFFESNDVAQAWMNSPSHRENILKGEYKEIGIGVASGVYEGRNTVFVAQFFGTPMTVIPPQAQTPVQTVTTTTSPKDIKKVTPKVVIIKPAAPVSIKVLGEATTSPIKENDTIFMRLKSFTEKVLTSPREYVSYIFGGILLLTILALILVLFIRSEMAHPMIIARGVALMAVIAFLLFVNIKILGFDTKVPTDSLGASIIAY